MQNSAPEGIFQYLLNLYIMFDIIY